MKSYPKYIPSPVIGVDHVPEHWKTYRLKSLAQIIPSNVDKKSKEKEQEVYLCNYLDVYNNDFIIENDDFMKASASETQIEKLLLQDGDVIATKDSEDSNDIGIPALVRTAFENVVCGYHLTLIRSNQNLLDGYWLYWYIRSNHTNQYFAKIARGITRFALGTSAFKNITVPLPSIDEQKSIAHFLDQKVSLINETIADKKKLLNLYEEEKMAQIKNAVSRGIDSNVEFKDSGIEWLGVIPEHWEVSKIRYLCNEINTGKTPSTKNPEYYENGMVDWYGPKDFDSNLYLKSSLKKITQLAIKDFGIKLFPCNSILLVSIGATLGKVGITKSPCFSNQQINAIVFNEDLVLPEFALYYLNSVTDYIVGNSVVSTLNILNQNKTKDLLMSFPNTIAEQVSIVNHIHSKNEEIQNKLTNINKEIKFLNEYKDALVFEAVTGKIDVSTPSLN